VADPGAGDRDARGRGRRGRHRPGNRLRRREENGTVTLKGSKGRTITLDVKDPQKLDAVKVGDPVVASYVASYIEAGAFQIK